MYIAQNGNSTKDILTKGMFWDMMITSIYLLIPFVFFGVNDLTFVNKAGLVLIVIAILMLKL